MRELLERRDDGFHWRGKDISRIEGLSDAVFAFAITLLVVSLEAPHTFAQLRALMHGFLSFGICFAMLILIWHAQYVYFRRYALDDTISFVLNAILLFAVAFYVYPLKFLFSTLVDQLTGYRAHDASGAPIAAMLPADWQSLMTIYGAGFVALYALFALLYLHAYRQRERLGLDAIEVSRTRSMIQEHLLMMAVGIASIVLARLRYISPAGMTYMLIGPLQWYLGHVNGERKKRLVASGANA